MPPAKKNKQVLIWKCLYGTTYYAIAKVQFKFFDIYDNCWDSKESF